MYVETIVIESLSLFTNAQQKLLTVKQGYFDLCGGRPKVPFGIPGRKGFRPLWRSTRALPKTRKLLKKFEQNFCSVSVGRSLAKNFPSLI